MYLLIKPASGACNLRCRYCFYADEMKNRAVSQRPFLSEELFDTIVDRAITHMKDTGDRALSIGFQGGEPTLVGLPFFRHAVAYVKEKKPPSLRVEYFLQTNGSRIDDDWAAFLKEHGFLVGLSLDGNAEIHDKFRLDTAGKGTQKSVIRAAEILKKHGCDFNILTVITEDVARHPVKVYNYYKKLGFTYQQYIPCISPLDGEALPFELSAGDYGKFLCTLFDLWYKDVVAGETVYHREFENYIGILLGKYPEECGMIGRCSIQYLIESDGSVYPCDFYALDACHLGSVQKNSFREIDEARTALGFIERSTHLPDACMNCPYGILCRGGCYRNRDENGKNRFCEAYQMLFRHALPRMQHLAQMIAKYH